MATNGDCTDIVCDMWLRFTLRTSAEDLVHKAVKIRQKWSAMVADVLNSRVVCKVDHLNPVFTFSIFIEIICQVVNKRIKQLNEAKVFMYTETSARRCPLIT